MSDTDEDLCASLSSLEIEAQRPIFQACVLAPVFEFLTFRELQSCMKVCRVFKDIADRELKTLARNKVDPICWAWKGEWLNRDHYDKRAIFKTDAHLALKKDFAGFLDTLWFAPRHMIAICSGIGTVLSMNLEYKIEGNEFKDPEDIAKDIKRNFVVDIDDVTDVLDYEECEVLSHVTRGILTFPLGEDLISYDFGSIAVPSFACFVFPRMEGVRLRGYDISPWARPRAEDRALRVQAMLHLDSRHASFHFGEPPPKYAIPSMYVKGAFPRVSTRSLVDTLQKARNPWASQKRPVQEFACGLLFMGENVAATSVSVLYSPTLARPSAGHKDSFREELRKREAELLTKGVRKESVIGLVSANLDKISDLAVETYIKVVRDVFPDCPVIGSYYMRDEIIFASMQHPVGMTLLLVGFKH